MNPVEAVLLVILWAGTCLSLATTGAFAVQDHRPVAAIIRFSLAAVLAVVGLGVMVRPIR